MSKVIFKIVDKIATKHNLTILDIFIMYCSAVVSDKKFKLELDEKEKEVVNQFLEIIENEEKVSEMLVEFIDDFDKAAEKLSMFFIVFISKDALNSKDVNKIKKSLNIYPEEIKDSILKSLEMLSAVKILKEKKEIIKEVINTILILTQILKVLNETK